MKHTRGGGSKRSWIGVISDTHGLLRPQALELLHGCDRIIHAGDIGAERILTELGRIAPLTAVRGNNDTQPWAHAIPETARLRVHGRLLHVLHDLKALDFDPATENVSVVIAGHSHKPSIANKDGVLFLNPGSAGPRRFSLPTCLAKLYVSESAVRADIVELDLKP
ncbi:MAG: metallophosphoesterase family protein [Xanthomonadaceae bacterium]|nr:metallophosphoesterase family protein [Xanthomonadaceae bacterium]